MVVILFLASSLWCHSQCNDTKVCDSFPVKYLDAHEWMAKLFNKYFMWIFSHFRVSERARTSHTSKPLRRLQSSNHDARRKKMQATHTLGVRREHHGDIKQLLSVPLVGTDLQTERASQLAVNRLIVTSAWTTSNAKWQPWFEKKFHVLRET